MQLRTRTVAVLLLLLVPVLCFGKIKKRKVTIDRNQVFAGARLGIAAPLAMGRADDEVSFRDVAAYAFTASADGMWMYTPSLGLGAEVGYTNYPYKKSYWSSLNQRGTFDAAYKDIYAGLTGRVLMGPNDVKPYIGLGFGAHCLRNSLDFVSTYAGTGADESVSYTSNKFIMGFAFAGGVLCKIAPKVQISTTIRLNVIPFLKEEEKTITDPYTFETKRIMMNPHGNQNNLTVCVGVHFGVNSPKVKR